VLAGGAGSWPHAQHTTVATDRNIRDLIRFILPLVECRAIRASTEQSSKELFTEPPYQQVFARAHPNAPAVRRQFGIDLDAIIQ
jgi:hypothetical protein